jgi:hypothetical protein
MLSWSGVQQADGQDSFCNAQAKPADCHSSQVLARSALRCKRHAGFARHPHMAVFTCCKGYQSCTPANLASVLIVIDAPVSLESALLALIASQLSFMIHEHVSCLHEPKAALQCKQHQASLHRFKLLCSHSRNQLSFPFTARTPADISSAAMGTNV